MTKKITLEYYGVRGEGRTVKDAKTDAGRKIERFIKDYEPRYVKIRDSIAVVFRCPDGGTQVQYPMMCGDWRHHYAGGCFSNDEPDMAMYSAVCHLADVHSIPLDDPEWEQIADAKMRQRAKREHAYKMGFQIAYKAAPDSLPGDCDRHRWACDHAAEFAPQLA